MENFKDFPFISSGKMFIGFLGVSNSQTQRILQNPALCATISSQGAKRVSMHAVAGARRGCGKLC